MTKKLKLKVKLFRDNYLYDVTGYEEREQVSVYDKRTGSHMDYEWADVQGFVSENPKLIATKILPIK